MERMANSLAILLGSQGVIKEEDVDICKYGLEVFLTSALEILSILLLSLFVGNGLETLLFFVAFIPLRIYAGGYHADTRLRCYAILLFVYSIFSIVLMFLPPSIYATLVTIEVLFSAIIVFLFAPVLHNNKQLNEIEVRTYRKISRSIILVQAAAVLFLLFVFNSNVYILAFTLGQLSVVISMLAAILKKQLKEV